MVVRRSLFGVTTFAGGLVTAAAAVLLAVVPSASASAAVEPITCENLIDEAAAEQFESSGYTLLDDTGIDPVFETYGGVRCLWGVENSGLFVRAAYSPITADQSVLERSRAAEKGLISSEVAQGTLFSIPPSPEGSDFIESYLFTDTAWYYTFGASEEFLFSLVSNVERLTNSAPNETGAGGPAGSASPNADDPSVLGSLETVQSLGLTPARALATAALTVVLVIVVGFPGILIQSTTTTHAERLFGWTRGVRESLSRGVAPARRLVVAAPRWVPIAIGVASAAAITGFIDPGFGTHAGASARLFASLVVAILIESVVAALVAAAFLRRSDASISPRMRFVWPSLLLVAAAVVFTRVSGFEPGIVFGLVLGLVFGVSLTAIQKARVVLVTAGVGLAIAVISWFSYSALVEVMPADSGFAGVLILETLSGVTIAGIAPLPIALLPLAALDGGSLWASSRATWALAYGVGLWMFLIVLLPLPISWDAIGGTFAGWIGLYAAFALFAVSFWALMTLIARQPPRAPAGTIEQ